jgi:hypothetical protein
MWSSICSLALAIQAVNYPVVSAVNINNIRDAASEPDWGSSPTVLPSREILTHSTM